MEGNPTAGNTNEMLRRARVTGRVQGVFFRASAAEQARALGLTGYARNQADGSVEVVMQGGSAEVERMLDWLRRGPPMARVDRVEVDQPDPWSVKLPAGFATG